MQIASLIVNGLMLLRALMVPAAPGATPAPATAPPAVVSLWHAADMAAPDPHPVALVHNEDS
ncbi:MAG TPA: hypothetical protein VJU81_08405 [Methylomirabilota bacterium]|nr:hypothetical protein [Methylomirabilota bacterium]